MTEASRQYVTITRGVALLVENAEDRQLMARQLLRATAIQTRALFGPEYAATRLRALADELEK